MFDRTFDALAKTLDMRAQKETVIASNVANADTPGYQAQALDFESSLSQALSLDDAPLDRTDANHMTAGGEVGDVKPDIYNEINNVVKEDGNTVDRDAEMVDMAQNQILYDAAADLMKKKLGLLKYAITEGGSH
jgi:flagellar basal-body rod protein FlgB